MQTRRRPGWFTTRWVGSFFPVFVAALIGASSTRAEEATEALPEEEPQVPDFLRVIEWTPPGHVEPLRYGLLLSLDGAAGREDASDYEPGFAVTDARISLLGKLEKGFGYFIQANLIQSRPLLDLIIDWRYEPTGFEVSAGYFRTPFSAELLIAAPHLDLIQRSQIVRALAPARQVGIQLDQEIVGDALVVRAGAFNGNGLDTNDDNRFLYTLRFDGRIRGGERRDGSPAAIFEYGVNGAYSKDDDARLGLDLPDPFAGERWLAGADMRWTRKPVFVSAEAIYGSIEPNGISRRDVYGYQATIGWDVSRLVQLLARYDGFHGGSLQSDRDLAIASLVLNFTAAVSLQVELAVPTRGEDPTPGGVASLALTF